MSFDDNNNSIKFLKSSGIKFWFDKNNNGNPAFWIGTTPNAAKDNYSIEFTSTALLPNNAGTSDLGSAGKQWKDLYLSGVIKIDGVQVIKEQLVTVADPAGGATIDVQCRAQLVLLLQRLRAATGHGLIA